MSPWPEMEGEKIEMNSCDKEASHLHAALPALFLTRALKEWADARLQAKTVSNGVQDVCIFSPSNPSDGLHIRVICDGAPVAESESANSNEAYAYQAETAMSCFPGFNRQAALLRKFTTGILGSTHRVILGAQERMSFMKDHAHFGDNGHCHHHEKMGNFVFNVDHSVDKWVMNVLLRQEVAQICGILQEMSPPVDALIRGMRMYLNRKNVYEYVDRTSPAWTGFKAEIALQTRMKNGAWCKDDVVKKIARIFRKGKGPIWVVKVPGCCVQLRSCLVGRALAYAWPKETLYQELAMDVVSAINFRLFSVMDLLSRDPGILLLDVDDFRGCKKLAASLDRILQIGANRRIVLMFPVGILWYPKILPPYEMVDIKINMEYVGEYCFENLMQCQIRLQKGSPSPLSNFVPTRAVNRISAAALSRFLHPLSKFNVGRTLSWNISEPFVDRTMEIHIYIKPEALEVNHIVDCFMISGTTEGVIELSGQNVSTSKDALKSGDIKNIVLTDEDADDMEKPIPTLDHKYGWNKSRPLHRVRKTPKGFRWMATTGSTYALEGFVDNKDRKWLSLFQSNRVTASEALSGRKNNRRIITGEPGCGKSHFLRYCAHLARKKFPSRWIITANFEDFVPFLEEYSTKVIDKSVVHAFLTEAACAAENHRQIEEDLLDITCWVTGDAMVFIDSFDVLPSHLIPVATDLILCLNTSLVSLLWVSTRLSSCQILEDTMGIRAVSLSPLDHEEKCKLLVSTWRYLGCDCLEPEFRARFLWDNLRGTKFLGAPLISQFLAEWYAEDISLVTKEFYVIDIFEDILERIIKQTINSKGNAKFDEMKDSLIEKYTYLGLSQLLNDEEWSQLKIEIKEAGIHLWKSAKPGNIFDNKIIDIEKKKFVHRSFAEFFVALWMKRKYKVYRKSVMSIQFNPSKSTARTMFDYMLARGQELHLSILDGKLSKVGDPASRDQAGRSALHLAVQSNCPELVEAVLDYGTPLELKDGIRKATALSYAVALQAWDSVSVLVRRGAVVPNDVSRVIKLPNSTWRAYQADWPVFEGGSTALHQAASKDSWRLMKTLLATKPNVNARDAQGRTPLHCAAPNLGVLSLLLDAGSNPNARDSSGKTPLHEATIADKKKCVWILIQNKADPKIIDKEGMNPLHYAARKGSRKILGYLHDAGGYLNIKDVEGNTPVHYAMFSNHVSTVRYLVRIGADPVVKGQNGVNVMFWAIHNKHWGFLNSILNAENAFAEGPNGSTLLHLAAKQGNVSVIKSLLALGVDVGDRDEAGDTALHVAAMYGNVAAARALLEAGANVRARGAKGREPFHCATETGRKAITQLLLKNGAIPPFKPTKARTIKSRRPFLHRYLNFRHAKHDTLRTSNNRQQTEDDSPSSSWLTIFFSFNS